MRLSCCFLVVLASGCAPDLRTDHPFDGEQSTGELVSTEDLGGGVTKLVVSATSKTAKVYVDLDELREMKTDEAFESNGWDLSLKRFEIFMNGGSSNPMGVVRAAVLKDQDFDSLTQAPADGYLQDGAETVFNSAEGGWYFYDLGVHRLITRDDLMYVVQTSSGAYKKLKMLNYYDEAGTPGMVSMKVAEVAAP
ncbi:MAG: HmuY family protein [Myxococcota bacterium]